MLSSGGSLAWLAVIVLALALFWSPVIVAAVRGTEQIGPVVLLTLLGLAGGLTWFAAWFAVFRLPAGRGGRPGPYARTAGRADAGRRR